MLLKLQKRYFKKQCFIMFNILKMPFVASKNNNTPVIHIFMILNLKKMSYDFCKHF